MVPARRNVRRGFYRNKMQKQLRTQTLHRRSMVESAFGALKQTHGSSVSSRKARAIRAEVLCRLISYNLFKSLNRLFQLSPGRHNI
jgi:hypothetical protein